MENTKEKKRWRDNIIWILAVSALVMIGGDLLAAFFLPGLLMPETPEERPYFYTFMSYIMFLSMWASVVFTIAAFEENRYIKGHVVMNDRGNRFSYLGAGLLAGFLLNGFCALVAWLHGDIKLSFVKFDFFPSLLLFVAVFVQSSAEEVFCRGFMYQRLLKVKPAPIVAIVVNSLFFAVFHLGNDGITALAFYDLFITGIFFSLVVYYFDSLWMAMGLHATWNFTQSILLGLPNSGASFPYSIYRLNANSAHSSFAYDTGFGLEGTVLSAGLMTFCCIVLYIWKSGGKKKLGGCVSNNVENIQHE